MHTVRLGLLLALACAGAQAEPVAASGVAARIDELLERPAARRTLWGILVRDLESGATVYERNPDKLFLPASNAKLFSTALALARLGPDYRFTTTVAAEGRIDENGVLHGDLRLVGGADPNLSARILPYRRRNDFAPDRLAPLRHLALSVRDFGIRRIRGDIVGDDSRYVWQPYPRGWSYADTLQGYGSPVSALVFNDNLIEVRVGPGAAEAPARLQLTPTLNFYRLSNRTSTSPTRLVSRSLAVRWGREPGEVVLAGQIPLQSRGRTFQLAANDPARYAAVALRAALADRGIEVEGEAVAAHLLPDGLPSLRSLAQPRRPRSGRTLAEIHSQPLAEAIRVVNKDSQNLHAEILLREVALQEAHIGSQEAAVASLRRFLASAGLESGAFIFRDGSGLSRHNLLAPTAAVGLLAHMWHSPHRDAYLASLPIAGLDGTLDWRFQRSPARGRVLAKTGSMSHVLALSGYVLNEHGPPYAFSIFANNFGLASSSTRQLMDLVVTALVRPTTP